MATWHIQAAQQLLQSKAQHIHAYAQAAGTVMAETVWPTRCVLCGSLGEVLCRTCVNALVYIDQWKACPRCGAPFGMYQCSECNSYSLASIDRKYVPFSACVSAVVFDETSARIARARKDLGERRLAGPMAYAIACAIPPAWVGAYMQPSSANQSLSTANSATFVPGALGMHCAYQESVHLGGTMPKTVVSYVPATVSARRMRGFDHAAELAREVARLLGVPLAGLLAASARADQRGLGRSQRATNTRNRFTATHDCAGTSVILVDDVYTTGATLMAAADALCSAGAHAVYGATFCRV